MRSVVGAICIFAFAVRAVDFLCADFDVELTFDVEGVFDVEVDFTGVTVFFVCEVLCDLRRAIDFVGTVFVATAGDAKQTHKPPARIIPPAARRIRLCVLVFVISNINGPHQSSKLIRRRNDARKPA
jgi:hypothetical protein